MKNLFIIALVLSIHVLHLKAESAIYIPDSISDSGLYIPTTFTIIHVACECLSHNVTVSAESVDGSTPGARVTWSTTAPPECVASVTVEFRTSSSGSVVRSYTTTSTSETEVIETGLLCGTVYTIKVKVTGVPLLDHRTLASKQVDVTVGGEVTACVASSCSYCIAKVAMCMLALNCPIHRHTTTTWNES